VLQSSRLLTLILSVRRLPEFWRNIGLLPPFSGQNITLMMEVVCSTETLVPTVLLKAGVMSSHRVGGLAVDLCTNYS
jgi:hypothetical protein